jgi:hypothetical protein
LGINISRLPTIYLFASEPLVVAAAPRITLFTPVVILPLPKVNVPLMVGEVEIINPAGLVIVRLFENVVALDPERVWATLPSKVIRPVPWIKVPLFEKFPPTFTMGLYVEPRYVAPLFIVRFFAMVNVRPVDVAMVFDAPVKVILPGYVPVVTIWVPVALYSIVEVEPSVTVGLLVELNAVVVLPENPAVFAVLKVPLIEAEPGEIMLVPASMVELAATVNDLAEARPMLKFPVENKLPLLTFPTAIFPVTLVEVIAALNVAPVELVLLMFKLQYVLEALSVEKKLMVCGFVSV